MDNKAAVNTTPLDFDSLFFLSGNDHKIQFFQQLGMKHIPCDELIPEVLSSDVGTVSLYKAHHANMNNIFVEDTSLYVESSPFLSTEIKHTYDWIKDDESFHLKKAIWKISVCAKQNDLYFVSTASLEGVLQYPQYEKGYHFNKLFSIICNDKPVFFDSIAPQDSLPFHPRYLAFRNLKNAFNTNDFSEILVFKEKDIPDWKGKYQQEASVKLCASV